MKKTSKFIFRILRYLLLFVFLYLIIGALAPFARYVKVSDDTKAAFSRDDFYQDGAGPDRVMLLEDNLSALTERIQLLNQAREKIIISTFDMRPGESTLDLLAILLHKADEGVNIQFLVDGFSSLAHMEGEEVFYAFSSHPNVELKVYNEINLLTPWKTQGRMHDKYVIVDDLAYILGGRNMFDYFIGDYPTDDRSYDREVLVYNTGHGKDASRESSLFQVESYFQDIWDLDVNTYFHNDPALQEKEAVREQTELLNQRYEKLTTQFEDCFVKPDYPGRTFEAGKIQLISNPTTIYGKEPIVFYTLSELMKEAKQEVLVHTPYAVFNDYMYRTMEEITDIVPVTLLLNARENGDNFFGSSDYTFNKKKVLQTGVSLFEYSGGLSYHGKSLVIDEELAIVGSYNFDLRSTYMDTELMLSIQSPALARELKGYMESLQEDCRIVKSMDEEIIPEGVIIEEVPSWKRAAWHIVGFIMQPFRFVI